MSRQMARAPKRRRLNARKEAGRGEDGGQGSESESRPGRAAAAAAFGGVGRMLGK